LQNPYSGMADENMSLRIRPLSNRRITFPDHKQRRYGTSFQCRSRFSIDIEDQRPTRSMIFCRLSISTAESERHSESRDEILHSPGPCSAVTREPAFMRGFDSRVNLYSANLARGSGPFPRLEAVRRFAEERHQALMLSRIY
jgi:hypothetical protein